MPLAEPQPPPTRAWPVCGVASLVVFALGGVATARFAATGALPEQGGVLDGTWAAAASAAYEDALPGRHLALGLWGALEYGLLGAGRPGVVVGPDGWLISSEELTQEADWRERLDEAVVLARLAQERLDGGRLVVAVLPSKARLLAEGGADLEHPEALGPRYAAALQAFGELGAVAPDLRPALTDPDGAPRFFRADTHWTGEGSAAVAATLAAAVGPQGDVDFVVRRDPPVEHTGDLVGFLALGAAEDALGPPTERYAPIRIAPKRDAALALFGDVSAPVTLVGTSYSADARWGFAASLQLALRAELINHADPGQGPFAPMRRWLDAAGTDEAPLPALLIWELPERSLSAPDLQPHPGDPT